MIEYYCQLNKDIHRDNNKISYWNFTRKEIAMFSKSNGYLEGDNDDDESNGGYDDSTAEEQGNDD